MDNKSNILDILKEAISIEIYGQEYYSIFSDIVEEENAKSIFRRLSWDEGDHKQLLEKEYRQISGKSIEEEEWMKRTGKKPGEFSRNHLSR